MAMATTQLGTIFDFTVDELEQNRAGSLSHRQKRLLQHPHADWQSRVFTPALGSITFVFLPAGTLFWSFGTPATWVTTASLILLIAGILATALLVMYAARASDKRREATADDLAYGGVRYFRAVMMLDEERDIVYAADVHHRFYFHTPELDQLPVGDEFVIYCTAVSHRVLSVEPVESDNQGKKARCLPLSPEVVAPWDTSFDKPYMSPMPGKATI